MKAGTYDLVLDSPVGRIGVSLEGAAVCRIDFVTARTPLRAPAGAAARRVAQELERYFSGDRLPFSVPVVLHGTPFQQRVWTELRNIPVGRTLSYGAVAARLGSGARAVGNACRNNPVSVIVPCHRVTAARGLGGYAGHTSGAELRRKRWLLEHEGASCA